MAHAFDCRGFEQMVADGRRLLGGLVDHERSLGALIDSARDGGMASIHLAALGELSAAARDNRQAAVAMLTRLVGESLVVDTAPQRPIVLVVDDSQDTRDLTAIALEASGFYAITAGNGLEGVLVAHYVQPTVILMDITMPVLDGIEAARLLKSSAVTRHVHLIAHTAMGEYYAGPLATLFADVLPKPSRPDAIVASIRRLAQA